MLSLPGPTDPLVETNKSLENSTVLPLQICALDVPSFLNVDSVTWNSRPRCANLPTVFQAQIGTTTEVLARFPCAWATYHSFELACASGEKDSLRYQCVVDVWSNHTHAWGEI